MRCKHNIGTWQLFKMYNNLRSVVYRLRQVKSLNSHVIIGKNSMSKMLMAGVQTLCMSLCMVQYNYFNVIFVLHPFLAGTYSTKI